MRSLVLEMVATARVLPSVCVVAIQVSVAASFALYGFLTYPLIQL